MSIGDARGVMVIVVGNGHGESSPNLDEIDAFHIALIPLGKVWIHPIILPAAIGN